MSSPSPSSLHLSLHQYLFSIPRNLDQNIKGHWMQRNVSSQHCNQSRDLLNIRNTKESGYNEKKKHQKTNPKFLLCFVHFTEKPPTILNKPTLMPVPVAGGTVRRVSPLQKWTLFFSWVQKHCFIKPKIPIMENFSLWGLIRNLF